MTKRHQIPFVILPTLGNDGSMTEKTFDNRADFFEFQSLDTRWMDNDAYGHMNNVVHYSLIDTAVTNWQRDRGFFDFTDLQFFVVESGCKYLQQAAYPDKIHLGLCVTHIGRTSWRYDIGLFRNQEARAFALGFFAQVQVDANSQRPTPIGQDILKHLQSIQRT
jgi:acyl-CoA thioester hydrolase